MQRITIVLLLILNFSCYAQNEIQFEYNSLVNQFMSYQPVQKSNVSDLDFNKGIMLVRETKKALQDNPNNVTYVDYFNMMSAFLSLKESQANIMVAFEKLKNADGSCELFLYTEKHIENNPKYDIIREAYNKELLKCKSKTTEELEFNILEYCNTNDLDYDLVEKIVLINDADKKYRKRKTIRDYPEHKELDIHNQALIDSLYAIHRTYIGKNLVGEKFENVMWSVIQHSNPEMMERYLPVVHKGVKEKQIKDLPLKMLIDRFYGLKYGYQFFGSQIGFGFKSADEETRKKIEIKYDLE
ncbi:hypothetical protein [Ancylomarina euxinus]|nr:hypothetical protein [Ancylomarina euxinus]MCZ4696430.1 hypothetical protein [Ancylomarina euxinus]MUP16799.1 hypothetical protein [Ancylomarina euxinus]